MISLSSDISDSKGQHARGWLFYDADCIFCTRVARLLADPMRRRGLGVAPLQDPRVAVLLALPHQELLRAIRFVSGDGAQYAGSDALIAVARELRWLRPLVWLSRFGLARQAFSQAYQSIARQRHCRTDPGAALACARLDGTGL